MEITKGVRLHFIQSEKFKTNKIRVRFSAPMSKETVAGRVLTASMLETVNAVYPTSQAFRLFYESFKERIGALFRYQSFFCAG